MSIFGGFNKSNNVWFFKSSVYCISMFKYLMVTALDSGRLGYGIEPRRRHDVDSGDGNLIISRCVIVRYKINDMYK